MSLTDDPIGKYIRRTCTMTIVPALNESKEND
jgi:hypothetical protein